MHQKALELKKKKKKIMTRSIFLYQTTSYKRRQISLYKLIKYILLQYSKSGNKYTII
jgi:hypothetical protein